MWKRYRRTSAGTSTSAITAAMTIAPSVASGRSLEEPGEKEQRDDRQHGDDEPGELRAGARGAVDGRLGEAAADDHAAREPRADVRGAETDQLAVGVDLVVVLGGVGLGGAEPLHEADQHHSDGRRGQIEVVAARRRPAARRREARSRSGRRSRRRASRSNRLTARMPRSTATSEAGTTGAYALGPSTRTSEHDTDEQRDPARALRARPENPRAARRSCPRSSRPRRASGAGRP